MGDFIKFSIIVFSFLSTLAMFMFPLIVSIVTGSWWLTLLFFISWIPTVALIIFWGAVINTMSDW